MLAPSVSNAAVTPLPLIATITGDARAACDSAIRDGADFIAVSIVVTQDGTLIVAAGNELSTTTDIAHRSDFAARRTIKHIGSAPQSGWFAEDFSLAELKTLGPLLPGKPKPGTASGGGILTLKDVIDLARAGCIRSARVIGIYARLFRPAYFSSLGLDLEPRIANTIRANGYDSPVAAMYVESAEAPALKTLAAQTRVRRVQSVGVDSNLTLDSLRTIRANAQILSVNEYVFEERPSLVGEAHSVGLLLHVVSDTRDQHRLEGLCRAKPDAIRSTYTSLALKARNATT